MKKILSFLILSCSVLIASAQTIYICKDGDYTTQELTDGLFIDLDDLPDSITFNEPAIPWTVDIVYNGTTATVSMPSFMADKVTCSSGNSSQVSIVNTDISHEVTYNVSGSSTAGSLVIKADYKMTVNLDNVNLTSPLGEAMRFKCGKRIELVMAEGSNNTFADTNDNGQTPDPLDNHKACIYTKGHLEITGAGTLNVTGNYNHAIAAKEYIKVKKTVNAINILGAVNDAIHAGQYFQMNGGTINIDGTTVGDGIQVEFKTDDLGAFVEDEENTGEVTITDGTINITMAANPDSDPDDPDPYQDTKCIKADGNVTITGGTLVLNANARGSRGIQADGDLSISQAEGSTTSITINATARKCSIEEHEDDPDKCMGINMDGNIDISGGTINIIASGVSANAIKTDGNLTVTGGNIDILASGTSSNGMKIVGNATFTGGSTKVSNKGSKSQGIVYSGTRIYTTQYVSAAWTYKKL